MSREITNRIVFILSLLGFGASVYLTLAHLNHVPMPCTRHGGCEEVAADSFAKGLGIPALQAIPTAAFGAGMYIAMAVLSMMRAAGMEPGRVRIVVGIQWALTTMGVAITGYLTYREAFVIHAWCWLCVTSAVIVALLFATSTYEQFTARHMIV